VPSLRADCCSDRADRQPSGNVARSPPQDRRLGLLSLRTGDVTPEMLREAMVAWGLDSSRGLGDVLTDVGLIDAACARELERKATEILGSGVLPTQMPTTQALSTHRTRSGDLAGTAQGPEDSPTSV
jgi:hypothetical protein